MRVLCGGMLLIDLPIQAGCRPCVAVFETPRASFRQVVLRTPIGPSIVRNSAFRHRQVKIFTTKIFRRL